jgi:hypothetical protein
MSLVSSMIPPGPVRSAAIVCAVSSMLGSVLPAEPSVAKLALTKLRSPVLSR